MWAKNASRSFCFNTGLAGAADAIASNKRHLLNANTGTSVKTSKELMLFHKNRPHAGH
jgi:hypothetical protein